MKTSNLFLLSVPLLLALICSSFVVAVNTNYRKGEFTYVDRDKAEYSRQRVNQVKTIVVDGVADCFVVVSDSVSMEVHHADEDKFDYAVFSDSIRISQKAPGANRMFIFLPSGSRLVAHASKVTMKGAARDEVHGASYDVLLQNSKLLVSSAKLNTFLNKLQVKGAGRTELTIADFVHIEDLTVENVTQIDLAQGWKIGNFKTSLTGSSEMTKAWERVSIKTE